MKRILFLLLVLSLFFSAGSTKCCSNINDYVQSYVVSNIDSSTHLIDLDVYYDNTTLAKKMPIINLPIYFYISDSDGNSITNNLMETYTDNNGKASFDFSSYITPQDDKQLQFNFFYCPSECACMDCLETFQVPCDLFGISKFNDLTDKNIVSVIGSPPSELKNPNLVLPFHTSLVYTPQSKGVLTKDLDFTVCLPLIIIFALLGGALFLTGRNPFAGFDFSSPKMKKSYQYRASGRGVYMSPVGAVGGIFSSIGGIISGVKNLKNSKAEKSSKSSDVGSGDDSSSEGAAAAKAGMAVGGHGHTFFGSRFINLLKGVGRKGKSGNNQQSKKVKMKNATLNSQVSKRYANLTAAPIASISISFARVLLGNSFSSLFGVLDSGSSILFNENFNMLISDVVAQVSTKYSDGLNKLNEMSGTSIIEVEGKKYKRVVSVKLDKNGKPYLSVLFYKNVNGKDQLINFDDGSDIGNKLGNFVDLSSMSNNVVELSGRKYFRLMTSEGIMLFDVNTEKNVPLTSLSETDRVQLGKIILVQISSDLQMSKGYFRSSRVQSELDKRKKGIMKSLESSEKPKGLKINDDRYQEIKGLIIDGFSSGDIKSIGDANKILQSIEAAPKPMTVEEVFGKKSLQPLNDYFRLSNQSSSIDMLISYSDTLSQKFVGFNKDNKVIENIAKAAKLGLLSVSYEDYSSSTENPDTEKSDKMFNFVNALNSKAYASAQLYLLDKTIRLKDDSVNVNSNKSNAQASKYASLNAVFKMVSPQYLPNLTKSDRDNLNSVLKDKLKSKSVNYRNLYIRLIYTPRLLDVIDEEFKDNSPDEEIAHVDGNGKLSYSNNYKNFGKQFRAILAEHKKNGDNSGVTIYELSSRLKFGVIAEALSKNSGSSTSKVSMYNPMDLAKKSVRNSAKRKKWLESLNSGEPSVKSNSSSPKSKSPSKPPKKRKKPKKQNKKPKKQNKSKKDK